MVGPGGEADPDAETLGQQIRMCVRVNDRPGLGGVPRDRRHHRPGNRVIASQHEDSQSGTCAQQLIDDAFGNGQRRHRPIAVCGGGAVEHRARPAPLLVAQHVVGQELRHDEEIADIDDPGADRARREIGRLPKQRRPDRFGPKGSAARQPGPAIGRDPEDRHPRRADGRQRSAPLGLNLRVVARAIERLLQRFARRAPVLTV